MRTVLIVLLLFLSICSSPISACLPQFEKELRYLDLYLGLKPDNNGEIPEMDSTNFAQYISYSHEIDCDAEGPCLWTNSPSDQKLDTSDWWYFIKSDNKTFPVQIQPGPPEVQPGTHLFLAGNTSNIPDSAVLSSAPIACQDGYGNLTFSYWLYNHAKIEVLIVRSMTRRKNLQVLLRPKMSCHSLRPAEDVCTVEIEPIKDPFRIAIRAFNLKDQVVGSMAMIRDIKYHATICTEPPLQFAFNSMELPIETEAFAVTSISQLDCRDPMEGCLWTNGDETEAMWRVGRNTQRFTALLDLPDTFPLPNSSFYFLALDTLQARPYAQLQSPLIPCTKRPTVLSLRYWINAGTQLEVCSRDANGVSLSCAYLQEENSPGPIEIEVDAYENQMRFTFDVIAFDETSHGVAVVSNLAVRGLLCAEPRPLATTTINPQTIRSMFSIQPGSGKFVPYSQSLDCDFTKNYCSQWVNDDGAVGYGVVPEDSDSFPIPNAIKGNAAVFVLRNQQTSGLRSREVDCATNGQIMMQFMKSESAKVKLCALGKCAHSNSAAGMLVLPVNSDKPFDIMIEVMSTDNAIVVITNISTKGKFCPLKGADEIACRRINCDFRNGLCHYQSSFVQSSKFSNTHRGYSMELDELRPKIMLSSGDFDLPSSAKLRIQVTQHTFGSRMLLCPNLARKVEECEEIVGPHAEAGIGIRTITIPIDQSVRRFSVMFLHDKAALLGPATFDLLSIEILNEDANLLC